MKPSRQVPVLIMAGCVLVVAGVTAAEKAQGVKWRAKVTMQSSGLTVPEQTLEVCLPATDPDQAAMQQGQQGTCTMTNVKRSGDQTSADLKCTGNRPSETHWEMEKKGDTMLGSMTTKTADRTMNIKYNYTKVGGACEIQQAPAPGATRSSGRSSRSGRSPTSPPAA